MLLSNVDWKRKVWSKMMFSNVQERKGSLLQFILDFDCKGHQFVFFFSSKRVNTCFCVKIGNWVYVNAGPPFSVFAERLSN